MSGDNQGQISLSMSNDILVFIQFEKKTQPRNNSYRLLEYDKAANATTRVVPGVVITDIWGAWSYTEDIQLPETASAFDSPLICHYIWYA